MPDGCCSSEARTLRERAFCRLVEGLDHDSIKFSHTPQQIFQIHPVESNLSGLMSACAANTWSRDRLANIPIARAGRSALSDPELVPMLQDLANILASEATQAFSEAYFPGVPDVHVPEDHVDLVMRALQTGDGQRGEEQTTAAG